MVYGFGYFPVRYIRCRSLSHIDLNSSPVYILDATSDVALQKRYVKTTQAYGDVVR